MICDRWDIVTVFFPFSDRFGAKPRPALVLSPTDFNQANGHTILAMITTGKRTSWPSDLRLTILAGTGLRFPSLIRAKLFTLDNGRIDKRIGMLHLQDVQAARQHFASILP
jgi:mRNA interferase MazF